MKVSILAPSELDAGMKSHWLRLQQSNPVLASPFFCPEFPFAVAAVRDDVRIAVLEDGGHTVGFFPYQRRWSAGRPVGGRLSDHHGVIAAPDTGWDWDELLAATGMRWWRFDHLAADQRPRGIPVVQAASPGVDLSGGYAAYRQSRLAAGSGRFASLERKARKMARELGPLRFEADSRDPGVLETVMRLKSEQCRRTGVPVFFSWPWTRSLIRKLHQTDLPHFGGRLSALYAGRHLVAAHFGMRSRDVWHWWFPVYESAYATYSPGAQLLLEVARAAADSGHRQLDLGKGEDAYKPAFANCELPLVDGLVARPAAAAQFYRSCVEQVRRVRQWPVAQQALPLLRRIRKLSPG